MKHINFGNRVQFSFWGNVDYATNQDAKAARKAVAKAQAERDAALKGAGNGKK